MAFFKFGNHLIDYLFYFFIFISLYFALMSPNLTLGDTLTPQTLGEGTTWVTIVFLLLMVGIASAFFMFKKFRLSMLWLFKDKGSIVAPIILSLVILIQVIFVLHTHPSIGFDPGAIHEALMGTPNNELKAYFSLNTNNLPLLLLQHQIAVFANSTSWLLFDIVNVIFLDVAVLLNILIVALIDRQKVIATIYMHAIWILVFPMILVPYSDVIVMPLVSGLILTYVIAQKSNFRLVWRLFSALVNGCFLTAIYFIKPSAIVPIIAIVAVEFLYLFRNSVGNGIKWQKLKPIMITLLLCVGVITSYVYVNHEVKTQQFIKITPNRTIPAIHFINMGVSGNGGYNAKDALAMGRQPSQKAMVDYSKKHLIARLKKRGFFGYIKFLISKQNRNSSDGTFAWLIEGNFMTAKPTGTGLTRLFEDFVYPEGKYLSDFRYIAQVVWILLLSMIALGWRSKNKLIQILRLSIVGLFMYLLIFEGGRSRYLIQGLPVFWLMAALVLPDTMAMLRSKLKWLQKDVPTQTMKN
ncbi:hypothetical protein QMA56_03860 [Leuconostoc falkenbergense]|uniref:TIGR03766 family XrtG-associated glycosyltransferase n=1 Tax=Leuconostoc falkenbergense TaxID=2766470 RepID=UPI0024ADE0DC|nr:TIGR03766 family XrtG-associated glycosyltransferase [Leuconostoc falkenbergense]MDI6666843.1 hypothetical protein [Leuconostoc falkenbergense]